MATEEGFKIRVAFLRKQEDGLTQERERLELEKARCPRFAPAHRHRSADAHMLRARRCAICAKSSASATRMCHASARRGCARVALARMSAFFR